MMHPYCRVLQGRIHRAGRLGPDHGDEYAAEQGEKEGPFTQPFEILFVSNHVEHQHDHAARNAGYYILVQRDEMPRAEGAEHS